MEILKISSKSNPNSVAGAIAGMVKESNKAEMQAIGAGALNQAVKAIAIAKFIDQIYMHIFENESSLETENGKVFF